MQEMMRTEVMRVGLYDEKVSPFETVSNPAVKMRRNSTASGKKNTATVENKIFVAATRAAKTKYVNKDEVKTVSANVLACLIHMSEFRAEKFGAHAKLRNGGESYIGTVLNILTGNNSFDEKLSKEQFCDLYDFMLTHHFWGQFVKTPEGLKRNMLKMWNSDDYSRWSEKENKPPSHRPERPNTRPAASSGRPGFRGELKADTTYEYDYDYVSPEWDADAEPAQ